MTRKKLSKKQKLKREILGAREPGDLIPMDDNQREFLKLHNKFVDNPTMEAIMAGASNKGGGSLKFGQNPLPWEKPLDGQAFKHLKAAQKRRFKCKNKQCRDFNSEQEAAYFIVIHKKELDSHKFGRRTRVNFHCAVKCKSCSRMIKYIKYNEANRRAAQDPYISGPHQKGEKK